MCLLELIVVSWFKREKKRTHNLGRISRKIKSGLAVKFRDPIKQLVKGEENIENNKFISCLVLRYHYLSLGLISLLGFSSLHFYWKISLLWEGATPSFNTFFLIILSLGLNRKKEYMAVETELAHLQQRDDYSRTVVLRP